MKQIEIDIDPVAKPRMTRRDVWKKRPCVLKYRAYKDELRLKTKGFELGDNLRIKFIIPFPKSYSKKKCVELAYMPHKQKPDVDNLVKAVLDTFFKDDSHIYRVDAMKIWGYTGRMTIANLDDLID